MPWRWGILLGSNADELRPHGQRLARRQLRVGAELLIGLMLAAVGPLADLARARSGDVGLLQWMASVTGGVLVLDALVRARDRASRGLFSHLSLAGAAGRFSILVLASALFAIHLFAFQDYRVDDAYITFRYAQHLIETGSVSWNVGQPAVEGYSNFLWMLLAAAALGANADPLLVSRIVSLAALIVAAWLVARLARRVGGTRRASRLSALAFLAIPGFVFWGMSGLETASVVALALAFLEVSSSDLERRRAPWRSALVALALLLSRPETPLFLGLSLAPMLIGRDLQARRTALAILGITAALVLPYLAWKWLTFGSLVANSAVAKAGALRGLPIVTQAYLFAFPFLLLALARAARGSTRLELRIWLACAGYALAGVHVASQVAHQFRFFLPVLAGVCVVIGPALDWLATVGVPAPRRRSAFAALSVAFLLFALAPVFETRSYARLESAGLTEAHESIGRALAIAYEGEGLLAASDCGLIPYVSRMRTIDLWGLNDAHIARHGLDPERVMAEHPDVVILHSVGDETFRARESYDLAMHAAVLREPELVLRGRWSFSGYRLWVWSQRPLPAIGAVAGGFSPVEHARAESPHRRAPALVVVGPIRHTANLPSASR